MRLPLWKSCAEQMLADGIEHGKTYTAEFFEDKLKCKRDDMRFGLAVSEIRRVLETEGFYLSGRGLGGNSFIILPPENHVGVMLSYSSAAVDALKRGVILGTNTRLDLLKAEERRKHESLVEKLAMRLALIRKTKQVAEVVRTKKPALLQINAPAN